MLKRFGDTSDPLIARLVAMVVNEPARSDRFITVSQRDYEKNYWPYVAEMLRELEKGQVGVLPPGPVASMGSLITAGIALLFVFLSALGNLSKFIDYLRFHRSPLWMAALYLGGGLFTCIVAFVWLTRISDGFRSRRDRDRGTNP